MKHEILTSARLVATLALAVGAPHCSKRSADRPCTELPCSSAAALRATLTPAAATVGEHVFALEVDGIASTCTAQLTSLTALAHGRCTSNAGVHIGPVMRSKEMRVAGMVGYTEEPVPGQFEWSLTVYGQPQRVRVVHTTGGRTIVDRTASLTYQATRPNGPGCEPVCQAASETWTVP
jgi:hypothetical protein